MIDFFVYRYILVHGGILPDLQREFDMTRERMNALLRRLESHGFIYRQRSAHRKNGIIYRANSVVIGEPIHFTAAHDRMDASFVIP